MVLLKPSPPREQGTTSFDPPSTCHHRHLCTLDLAIPSFPP